jgi:hypothetical protein
MYQSKLKVKKKVWLLDIPGPGSYEIPSEFGLGRRRFLNGRASTAVELKKSSSQPNLWT